MPIVMARACTILGEFEQAQTDLIGKAVILTDGKAGTNSTGCASLLMGTMGSGLSRRSSLRSRAKRTRSAVVVSFQGPLLQKWMQRTKTPANWAGLSREVGSSPPSM
jgi:hypothetical protein